MKRMCQLIVSIRSDEGTVGGCSDLTCYEYVPTAGEQQRQCFDLRSTRTFTQREGDWQAGGLGGDDGGEEQLELSLDVCVNVTVGWKKATDTQSGAISRLADCMVRAGLEKMDSQ